MPQLTITLSGPAAAETQARNALVAAQFDNTPPDHDYGLPAISDQQAETFITVIGEDVDKAADTVRPLGWSLRVHHETPEPGKPSPFEILGERIGYYDSEIAELRARLARLEGNPPPIAGGAVESPPAFIQASTYGAEITRRAIGGLLQRSGNIGTPVGGLVAATDMQMSAPVSGMSVNVAPGEAYIPGTSAATQGAYYCRVSSTTNLAIAAADPTNPRVDRVCGVVTDAAYAGGTNTFALAVVTGTPTGGANLTNLTGVGAAPASSLTDGYVLAPNGATNIITADISNVATVASLGSALIQGITASGLAAALAQSAIVNQTGQTVKGAFNLATSQATSSATYTTLATPDQVSVVLPTNGRISVGYQALWQSSGANTARAAIFIGSNQLKVATTQAAPQTQAALLGGSLSNSNVALVSGPIGLASVDAGGGAYSGDVATGQSIGTTGIYYQEIGGSAITGSATGAWWGGDCAIQGLPAGTYTISVQFKASAGSVTASNRKLWVEAISYA